MVMIMLWVFPRTARTYLAQLRRIASSDNSDLACNVTWQAVEVSPKHCFIKRFKRLAESQKERKPVKGKYAK